MNLSKDKVLQTKIFCKENYKVVIIMRFSLYQSIIPKCLWSMRLNIN